MARSFEMSVSIPAPGKRSNPPRHSPADLLGRDGTCREKTRATSRAGDRPPGLRQCRRRQWQVWRRSNLFRRLGAENCRDVAVAFRIFRLDVGPTSSRLIGQYINICTYVYFSGKRKLRVQRISSSYRLLTRSGLTVCQARSVIPVTLCNLQRRHVTNRHNSPVANDEA